MTEAEVETIIHGHASVFPNARPRIISDNGPQFIAKDFKEFIRICGMTHVRTHHISPKQRKDREVHKTSKASASGSRSR